MDELLKTLITGYSAPVWLITIALAYKLFNVETAISAIWNEVINPYFARKRENSSRVVRGVMLEELLYSRYMQIARHLVNEAWNVMLELRDKRITPEQVSDRLRTQSRDVIANARQALGYYNTATKVPLSTHLENLSETRKQEFYAPITADILEHAQTERYFIGYERLRTAVLRESDVLLSEAIDAFLNEKNK